MEIVFVSYLTANLIYYLAYNRDEMLHHMDNGDKEMVSNVNFHDP